MAGRILNYQERQMSLAGGIRICQERHRHQTGRIWNYQERQPAQAIQKQKQAAGLPVSIPASRRPWSG
nr:hypothetical protein [uncultured Acetatifactor sp.]